MKTRDNNRLPWTFVAMLTKIVLHLHNVVRDTGETYGTRAVAWLLLCILGTLLVVEVRPRRWTLAVFLMVWIMFLALATAGLLKTPTSGILV
jgi:hypothetical protein